MTITYSLSENDFLTHQLYGASMSERIMKKRRRTRLIAPLAYVLIGLFYLIVSRQAAAIFLFVTAILWYLIYPLWERRRYVRHYQAYIRENFRDRIGKPLKLTIGEEDLFAEEGDIESKMPLSELGSMIEISEAIYLKLKTGEAIVLPKSQMENLGALKEKLKSLAAKLDIPYVLNDEWQWR